MEFLTILLTALGLAADCFAVALGASISRRNLSIIQAARVSLSFGLFQSFMPLLGWLAGKTVVELVEAYDHWIALALLGFIGGKMIWESFHSRGGPSDKGDISRGWLLITLSLATSIDALAVGLTFAFLNVNIVLASVSIGVVALLVSLLAFQLGKRAGGLIGKRAEIIGGLILIGIGIKIVIEHTL